MTDKKIYTREEFEELRLKSAKKMKDDKGLQKDSHNLLMRADDYFYNHQQNWLGEPLIQSSDDIMAMQEILYKTKPTLIVCLGTCWAGDLLFFASMQKLLSCSSGKVIGVDIYIPEELEKRIINRAQEYDIDDRIEFCHGSSIDVSTVKYVKERINGGNVLVVCDSRHDHEHVYKELKLYSPLLKRGNYMVVCDTIMEEVFNSNRDRPWGPGNSARTALNKFLEENKPFERDERIQNKLLLSCHKDGYICKVK